jgi:HlyD family secretion protein
MILAKNFLHSLWAWILSQIIFTLFIFVIILGSLYYFGYYKNSTETLGEYIVKTGNLEESVSLTGKVKPSEEANMTFEKSGTVKDIYVKVGENVKKGDILASLSHEDLSARVLEASASLKSQRALLEDLKTGARIETVEIKKATVEKANNDLAQTFKNSEDTLKNISISGNSVVRDNMASYFTGNFTEGYRINIVSCDSNTEYKVNSLKKEAEQAVTSLENISNSFAQYENDRNKQEEILRNIRSSEIKKIFEYLDTLKTLLSTQCATSNSSYDSLRTLVTTSRNTWSGLNSDLSLKINSINSAKTALTQAQEDLRIAQSGEKSEKQKQQEANVLAAEARLAQAQAEENKSILKAPFDGVVTNIDLNRGELVSPGGKSISLISLANFEIESKVSEIDIAKIFLNSPAKVTFDTYGDTVVFEASVANISPAGIISDGVPTYKTIFTFVNNDERIKSGMTANIDVLTKVHENTLIIPAKYVLDEEGVKKVLVKNGNGEDKRVVTLGARNLKGEVQVLTGVNTGETIVLVK